MWQGGEAWTNLWRACSDAAALVPNALALSQSPAPRLEAWIPLAPGLPVVHEKGLKVANGIRSAVTS